MLHDEVRALADVVSPVDHDRVMAIADEVEALESAIEFVLSGYELHTCDDGELRYRHIEKLGAFLPAPESLKRLLDTLKEKNDG